MKIVKIFKKTFQVPDWAGFCTIDRDGTIVAWELAPAPHLDWGIWVNGKGKEEVIDNIGQGDFIDWISLVFHVSDVEQEIQCDGWGGVDYE